MKYIGFFFEKKLPVQVRLTIVPCRNHYRTRCNSLLFEKYCICDITCIVMLSHKFVVFGVNRLPTSVGTGFSFGVSI